MTLSKQKTCSNTIAFAFLCLLAAIFLIPILLVNYLIIKKLENSKVIFPYHADYQQDKKG